MIDRQDVRQRVCAMAELVEAREWVAAARFERVLWHDVLDAVASGAYNAQDLAEQALRTLNYQFPRFLPRTPARYG